MAGIEYFLMVDVQEQKVYTNLTVRHYYNKRNYERYKICTYS